MKLVVMTKPTYFVEEDKILSTLFDEGLDWLHLYKPGCAPMYAERLLTLLPEYCHRRIFVHDHFYLIKEYGLAGICTETADEELPAGYKGRYTRTCTHLEMLKAAKKRAEYVLLKYIFDSQSEREGKGLFTLGELEEAARRGLIDKHVYALGGMNLENIRIARDLGFGGVAICGDLWNRFDIHKGADYRELLQHFEKLLKALR